jgi:hypothetical protein
MKKRRVCLLTSLSPEDVERKFALLRNKYDFVSTPSEAEYVVLDLANPDDCWFQHLPKREEPCTILPDTRAPTLLFCTGGVIKVDHNILTTAFGPQPRILPTPEALLDDLTWLELIFPVTKTAGSHDRLARELALTILRGAA